MEHRIKLMAIAENSLPALRTEDPQFKSYDGRHIKKPAFGLAFLWLQSVQRLQIRSSVKEGNQCLMKHRLRL